MPCPCHDSLCPSCGVTAAERLAALQAVWWPVCRLRRRTVDIVRVVTAALATASRKRRPVIRAAHGGSVTGAYRHAAETEAILVAAWPDDAVWWRLARTTAHRVTLAGAAASVLPTARPLYDRRYTSARRAEVYRRLLAELRSEALPWALLRRIGDRGPFRK